MSEDRTDYVFYGFDAGYDDINYDDWEKLIENEGNEYFDLIYDGMNGDFAFFGKVVASTVEEGGFDRQKVSKPKGTGEARRELKKYFADFPAFEFHIFTRFV